MSNSFFNRFVQTLGLGRPKAAVSAPVYVAVFGKHRAWDDHIPGIGLTQPALIDFNSSLYEGIIRNVDKGEWDNLRKMGNLQPFGHTLLWIDGGNCIAARCWQSVDGKGRDQYPMIVAALCGNQSRAWVIREAVPALKTLQDQCIAATSAAEIERLCHATENALRQVVSTEAPANATGAAENLEALRSIAERPEMGPDRLGLLRVLYAIERERPIVRNSKLTQSRQPARPFSLRVPLCADGLMASAELWLRFLSMHPDLMATIVACVPDHGKWLDLMIGHPGPSQIYCLRAPPEVFPFTTTVPYTLDPEFVMRVIQFLQRRETPANAVAADTWP